MEKVVVIVGAGLSGLTCAYEVLKISSSKSYNVKVIVLEGRDRIGGRMYSEKGLDLGAAWSWPANDTQLMRLIQLLNLATPEPQYQTGKVLQQQSASKSSANVKVIGQNIGPAGENSIRFKNGTFSIASQFASHLLSTTPIQILLNSRVTQVNQLSSKNDINNKTSTPPVHIEVVSTVDGTTNVHHAHAVVLAVPPRLIAKTIGFLPQLPAEKLDAMERTPTWMEDTGKVGLIYSNPFWRTKGFSGTAFSQCGPLVQVWDNSDEITFALCGFVMDDDSRNEITLRRSILKQLQLLFGPEAATPLHVLLKLWSTDPFTAVAKNNSTRTTSPMLPFGTSSVRSLHLNAIFAGTETAPNEHGHMNGAVIAGYRAASEVIQILKDI